jgi:CHAD domain-containing protein
MAHVSHDRAPAAESSYVIGGGVPPDVVVGSLRALLPTRHHPIGRHQFTILDTFDGRVGRTGGQLVRIGPDAGSTVAWEPRGGGGRLALRLNEPVGFAWDLPEGPLQRALAPVVGVRRLLEQADAEAFGSMLEVLDHRRKTVARLRVESGRVRLPSRPDAWRPLPTMMTLTVLRGYEDACERLVPVIESRPGVQSCPEGLQSLMLRHAGAPARADLSSLGLDLAPTIRADLGARQIHRALLAAIVDNEPGLRANLDTEFLHDFRVAVRRTRSLLGQIKHAFASGAVEHFSAEFSWLGRLTGALRDLDVLVLALREHRGDMPAADIEAVMHVLGQAQRREHEVLVEALNGARYQQLLRAWKTFLDKRVTDEAEDRNGTRLLAEVVARRGWRLARRIAGSAAAISEQTPAAHIHQLRIDAKKLRYLIDATPGFYDRADLDRILAALKKLQRALGDFNDAQVQEARLLECGRELYAAGTLTPALLTLGRLAEQRRQRGERLRPEVIDTLSRFRARDTQAACRRAFKRGRDAEAGR